jgi:hypothetical protein
MMQALHIFRKDVRRLRWALVGWCVVVATRVFIDTAGADIALGGLGPNLAIRQISTMLSMIYGLSLVIVVARLVQDEPLAGRDAFWLTRPLAPQAVMRAKLAFAVLFLIALPFAARFAEAAWHGTRAADITGIIPTFLLNQLIAVTVLWALAALTPSLTSYVIAIVGVIGAFVLFTASELVIALFVAAEGDDGGDYQFPDPTAGVVAGGLIALTALAVIVAQYRGRRISRSLAVAGIGVVLLFVVPPHWPWSFGVRPKAEVISPPPDMSSLVVTIDGNKSRVAEGMTLRRSTSPRREIAAPAIVTGMPDGLNVRTIVGYSRLELPNGLLLEDRRRQTRAFTSVNIYGSASGRESAIEAALGGVRLLNRSPQRDGLPADRWTTLLRVDEGDFIRYRTERGRLTTDLYIMFERGTPRGVLPLVDGVTAEVNRAQSRMVRVIRRATGCTVLFRRSYVESLFTPREHHDLTYALRNQSRGEAVASTGMPFHEEGFSAGGFFLPPVRIGGRGFVLEQYDFEFPGRQGFDSPAIDLDESWLRGAELVIVEMVSAGHTTRRVTLEGFRMTP